MNEGIKKNNIILASSSIYRSRLLKKYIKNFSTRIPDVDETPRKKESAKDLSLRLALSKAKKISNSEPDSFIIGSDQVASFKGNILGKPMNYEDAFNTIKKFSKEDVIFFTGIALINKNGTAEYNYNSFFESSGSSLSPLFRNDAKWISSRKFLLKILLQNTKNYVKYRVPTLTLDTFVKKKRIK